MDREKVIKGLDVCLKNIDQPDCPNDCPYLSDCSKYENRVVFQPLMRDAHTLLKEQEPYISKETRLNRDEYCRVGDVLDCFDGMDMKADEVFHAVCLIEWAMSKRSVPLDQLLKEQEAKPIKIVKNAYNHEFYFCPKCDGQFYDFYKKPVYCGRCGQAVKWE